MTPVATSPFVINVIDPCFMQLVDVKKANTQDETEKVIAELEALGKKVRVHKNEGPDEGYGYRTFYESPGVVPGGNYRLEVSTANCMRCDPVFAPTLKEARVRKKTLRTAGYSVTIIGKDAEGHPTIKG